MQEGIEEKRRAIKLLSASGLLSEREVERLVAELRSEATGIRDFQELCKQSDSRSLAFTIPIVPKPQMRARHAKRGKFSTTHKDKKQVANEETLNTFLMRHMPETPLVGPLVLRVKAFLPIPKSKSKKFKAEALRGEIRPIVKPDMDNILKHIKDCMSQMRFWEDDKQVVEYLPGTGKYYSDQPRWEIELRPWKPDMALLEVA